MDVATNGDRYLYRKPARSLGEMGKRGEITPEQLLATSVLREAWHDRGRRFRHPRGYISPQPRFIFRSWPEPDALGETEGVVPTLVSWPCVLNPDEELWEDWDGNPCDFWHSTLCEFWCDVAGVSQQAMLSAIGNRR